MIQPNVSQETQILQRRRGNPEYKNTHISSVWKYIEQKNSFSIPKKVSTMTLTIIETELEEDALRFLQYHKNKEEKGKRKPKKVFTEKKMEKEILHLNWICSDSKKEK